MAQLPTLTSQRTRLLLLTRHERLVRRSHALLCGHKGSLCGFSFAIQPLKLGLSMSHTFLSPQSRPHVQVSTHCVVVTSIC